MLNLRPSDSNQFKYGFFQLGMFLWVAIASVGLLADSTENIRFKRLTSSADGIHSFSGVNAIVQDEKSFIWFGTENGLMRYDGRSAVVYENSKNNPRSLSSNFVWSMLIDHRGDMWIATENGLNRYNRATNDFDRYFYELNNPNSLSNNFTTSVIEGSDKRIYVATSNGLSVLSEDRKEFIRFFHRPGDPKSMSHNNVRVVYEDDEDRIWVGTVGGGLNRFNPEDESFDRFMHKADDPNSLSHSLVRDIAEDGDGRLWVGTFGGGLNRLNDDDKTFTRYVFDAKDEYSIANNTIWDIFRDSYGSLWIGTDQGGLALYDIEKDAFISITHDPFDNSSLLYATVKRIFEDNTGDLWVATFPTGVNYFNRSTSVFKNYYHKVNDAGSISHSAVLRLKEDSRGVLWVGTEGGLNAFDRKSGTFKRYLHDPSNPKSLPANAVLGIEEDAQGNIWVGTWSGGLARFDRTTETFHVYKPDPSNPNSINSSYIWTVFRDSSDQLWIGTETGGINLYRPETDDFIHFSQDPMDVTSISFNFVWDIMEDSRGQLWVGTQNGLNLFNRKTRRFTRIVHDPMDSKSLSANRVQALFEDSNSYIWVATQSGGINRYDPNTREFRALRLEDGLPNDTVSSIQEDNQGYIWVGTVSGLAQIDPASFEVIKSYNKANGIVGEIFNRNASFKDKYGRLYFGSTEGLVVLHPAEIEENLHAPPIVLTDFKIFNESIVVGAKNSVLESDINETDKIRLDYSDSVFTIEFAALSYRASSKNSYAYMLEGFDKGWNHVAHKHSATYTNLDPGNYEFKVRGSNSDGVWNDDGPSVEIRVAPPPWKAWWAYLIYLSGILLVLFGFTRFQVKKTELDRERRLNAELVKIDKLKDQFLANTSHELRTPINGIIGLSETLLDGAAGKLNRDAQAVMAMIATSGKRLSNLINDILDYSKMTRGGLIMNIEPVDLHFVSNTVISLSMHLTESKNLKIINRITKESPAVLADQNRLQQILFNLLGNAIKFTNEGQITLDYELDSENRIIIRVIDTGVGIPEEKLDSIFESFQQVEGSLTRQQGGTGLGLAVTKQLVELHGGEISVESTLHKGSTFAFSLFCAARKPELSYNETTRADIPHQLTIPKDAVEYFAEQENIVIPRAIEARGFRILVVDDDAINRKVVTNTLSLHHYDWIEAESGEKALEIVENIETLPVDLIILDVMMPGMSGYEVCERIRKVHPIQSLPIIFLTARHQHKDLELGFEMGGNDFVTKPISKNELLSRIATHLKVLISKEDLEAKLEERTLKMAEANKELDAFKDITEVVSKEQNFTNLVNFILEEMVNAFSQSDKAVYWKFNSDCKGFRKEACIGEFRQDSFSNNIPQSYLFNLLDNINIKKWNGVVELNSTQLEQESQQHASFGDLKSLLIMVVDVEGEIVGVLALGSTKIDNAFTKSDIIRFSRYKVHIASAVSKVNILSQLGGNPLSGKLIG